MRLRTLHSWQVSAGEARELQRNLAPMVSGISTIPDGVRHLAGLDISAPDGDGLVRGAAVVLRYPSLEVEEVRVAEGKPGLPYIPGLLSFQETPVLTGALEQLDLSPDIIFVDGQGLAHPRRFGLACHIGLLTDTPTIGCAKSVLTGKYGTLDWEAGSQASLIDRDQEIGAALRTRSGVKPMYISVGHRVDLPSSISWVLACCKGKRMPEATRMAHRAAAGQLVPGLRSG